MANLSIQSQGKYESKKIYMFIKKPKHSTAMITCLIFNHLKISTFRTRWRAPRGVRKTLCLREFEYLDMMHRKDKMLYGDVIKKLRKL